MPRRWLGAAAALAVAALPPFAADARNPAPRSSGSQCHIPDRLPLPHSDGPTADQPVRRLSIGHYTLAISWSPQFCATGGGRNALQCGAGHDFGFTLHGLWPDGYGAAWPQYCRPAALLPQKLIRQHLCATPSVQLTQHEWAKHGTCTTLGPAQFLGLSRRLYHRLRFPDMAALARRDRLTAGAFARAFAAVNPGMDAGMMRITATRDGWLDEVWLCLDKAYRPARCPAHAGGLAGDVRLRIRAPR